jgi:hypothetical protein
MYKYTQQVCCCITTCLRRRSSVWNTNNQTVRHTFMVRQTAWEGIGKTLWYSPTWTRQFTEVHTIVFACCRRGFLSTSVFVVNGERFVSARTQRNTSVGKYVRTHHAKKCSILTPKLLIPNICAHVTAKEYVSEEVYVSVHMLIKRPVLLFVGHN